MEKLFFMKTLALAVVAVLAVVTGIPSSALAGIRVEHVADAVFVLGERDGEYPALFVDAHRMSGYRTDTVVGSLNIGFSIRRGTCVEPDDLTSCVLTDQRRPVVGNFRNGDVFEIEDDLSSARLRLTRHGVTHTVRWRATSEARPVVRDVDCGVIPIGSGIGFDRAAAARGRVFGRRVSTSVAFLETVGYSC